MRKSYKSAMDRLGRPPEAVEAGDVYRAVHEDPGFAVFPEAGLGREKDS